MAVVYKHKIVSEAKKFPINNDLFFSERIGFWGSVHEINPKTNFVTVRSDTGALFPGLPVACAEWVRTDDEAEYVTGERHLPPINSRVFVLTPTKTAAGAFVLCSGFARGETNTANFYAKDDSDSDKKENESLTVTQGGWIKTENYKNGNISIKSKDGKIEINLNNEENKEDDIEKKVSINAWGTSITIKEDGITFNTDQAVNLSTSNTMDISSDKKMTVTPKGGMDVKADGQNVAITCQKFSVNNTDFTVGA